jgi:hypothetical protein
VTLPKLLLLMTLLTLLLLILLMLLALMLKDNVLVTYYCFC